MSYIKFNPFKLRFGVIGTNFIVDWVLEAARLDPRFELVAIYSRTQEQADTFAAKHQIPYTFTSLEEMASSNLIDAVYIASPNFLHTSQSILFMQHGKHVLCEKPLASNSREAKLMTDTASRYNVVLMEAMKPTLTPNFLSIKRHIKEIGTIRRYFSCYCQYSSRYDKLKEGIVLNAFNPEYSNGAVMDLGVYTIYPMVVLFGRPQKIDATGLILSTGVDGQGAVNFEYKDMNATILYSKIADSFLPTEIQGEKATIISDRINTISKVNLRYRDGSEKDISVPVNKNEYFYEIAEFIDLVENGRSQSEINSHENSLITMEIIDEIRKQLGVVFPADNE
ncbi:Gfo/Idh/MocA family oxidoreductase [Dysgonomonas sp. OttesenSCG-928-M03]|nr:Gfo/Idh/MocA family oxidoreductase [Dysgonomonas sp. OttesenSCG-928-M03]